MRGNHGNKTKMSTTCIRQWLDEVHFGSQHIAFSHRIPSSGKWRENKSHRSP